MNPPKGTRDFDTKTMNQRRNIEQYLRDTVAKFGYGEISTPTFENLELFTKKSGEEIRNQIYAFKDKAGREIALRPEITAPVARMYNTSMSMDPKPSRLYYFGNCFRYEDPQAGRWREFYQFGVELIGSASDIAVVECITLAKQCLDEAGLKNYKIRYNRTNTLETEIDPVVTMLKNLDIPFEIDQNLKRGLDYYIGPVFEIESPELGAQKQICGGGAYDLSRLFDAQPNPSVGFAIGFDRLILALEKQGLKTKTPLLGAVIVATDPAYNDTVFKVANELRSIGLSVVIEPTGRTIKNAVDYANRIKALRTIIIGPKEIEGKYVTVKRMFDGKQEVYGMEELWWIGIDHDEVSKEFGDPTNQQWKNYIGE